MKIAVYGYNGMKNTGDDAMLWALVRETKARVPKAEICVKCHDPQALPAPVRGRVRGLTPPGFLRESLFADAVVFGGGSILSRTDVRKGLWIRAVAQKPLVGVSLSLGPFETPRDEQRVMKMLRRFQRIALRDRDSYEFLSSQPGFKDVAVRSFDSAVLLAEPGLRLRPRGLRIGLVPCFSRGKGHGAAEDLDRETRLIRALAPLRGDIDEVLVFAFNGHERLGDLRLARAVHERLREARIRSRVVSYDPHPDRTIERMAGLSVVVASRLHGGVLAYAAGVPFLQIAYHPKCSSFARTIGLRQEFLIGESEVDRVQETLPRVLEARERPWDLTLEEARSMARRGFDFLGGES